MNDDIISRLEGYLESAPHDTLARDALEEIGRLGEALAREKAGRMLAEQERDAQQASAVRLAECDRERLAARAWARRWKGVAKEFRAALLAWYDADETPGFPAAEAALVHLCRQLRRGGG